MWSHQSASAKLRTTKFSSEGLVCNSMKFCTSENFPLYGIIQHLYIHKSTVYINVQVHGSLNYFHGSILYASDVMTPYLTVQDLPQVNLLAEGKVIESEVLSTRVQVVLDLRERPQPTPTGGDVTDVHSNLVWPHPLSNKPTPPANQCMEYTCTCTHETHT